MPAQPQQGVSHTVQPVIHRVGPNAVLFHCIRKAVSCLGRQLLGDSLLPMWPLNKKLKISGFKPDPPITALWFFVPLLLPKRRLLRRNRVADIKKLLFPTTSCCLALLLLTTGLSTSDKIQLHRIEQLTGYHSLWWDTSSARQPMMESLLLHPSLQHGFHLQQTPCHRLQPPNC